MVRIADRNIFESNGEPYRRRDRVGASKSAECDVMDFHAAMARARALRRRDAPLSCMPVRRHVRTYAVETCGCMASLARFLADCTAGKLAGFAAA
ncbi:MULTISPECIES: hypothetical protein [Burkholderia]|uniref:hypothetical protein n=1 Tax=Burkholderia TaxID=32008 RepID=UPI0012E37559|nr:MULTISPECIES: hypothetical protein [Burkholderia]